MADGIDTAVMTGDATTGGLTAMLVIQNANVSLLAKALNQDRQNGRAAVQLIQSSNVGASQGAPEPGKGSLVDVTA